MHRKHPVDPALASCALGIPPDDYVAQILADYGVTHSHLNRDQNKRIERNAADSREQLRLHATSGESEIANLRESFDTKITRVCETFEAYISYHQEVHAVLKSEIKRAQSGIKALALAFQAHLREHRVRDLATSEFNETGRSGEEALKEQELDTILD
jgi:hypothetical protein